MNIFKANLFASFFLFAVMVFSGHGHASTSKEFANDAAQQAVKSPVTIFPELEIYITIKRSEDPNVAAQYIFWGDGVKTLLHPGQDVQKLSHAYTAPGEYDVQMGLKMTSGEMVYQSKTVRVNDTSALQNANAVSQRSESNASQQRKDAITTTSDLRQTQSVPQATVSNIAAENNVKSIIVQSAVPIQSLDQEEDLPDLQSGSNAANAPDRNMADLNQDCILSNADVEVFLNAFYAQDPIVDLAEPFDQFSLGDVVAFLDAFNFGSENPDLICPDGQVPHDNVLPAGDGFAGDIPSLENVGSASDEGYDAQAIARWDVVPFQTFDEPFEVGVVAFHKNGIDRVEFSLDGGAWTSVDEPRLNPRTGVVEYFAVLDPFEILDNDGQREDRMVEVQAIVYPKNAGQTRVLAGPFERAPGVDPDNSRLSRGNFSLFLYSNDNGTFDPVRFYVDPTLANGGGDGTRGNPFATLRQAWEKIIADDIDYKQSEIILTKPGQYAVRQPRNGRFDYTNDTRHWITIRSDNDVAREDVLLVHGDDPSDLSFPADRNIVTGPGPSVRVNVNMLRFYDISADLSLLSAYPSALFYNDNNIAWFDNMHFFQSETWADPDAGIFMRHVGGAAYVTESHATDITYCFSGKMIVRDSSCIRVSGDVFQTSRLMVNNRVNHVDGRIIDQHTDLFQEFAGSCTGGVENRIAYGVTFENVMNTQNVLYNCVGEEGFSDLAFVNIFVENINTGYSQNQPAPTDHLVLLNFGNPGLNWAFREAREVDGDASDGLLQKNLLMKNNVFSGVSFPQGREYLPDTMDVSHNHIIDGSDMFTEHLTSGVVYPAKNLERGAYGFGGPAYQAMMMPGSDLNNLILNDREGTLPRGPVSIFEPCKYNPDPVSLIAADPLKIGLGQTIVSGKEIEFYSNASYACRDELVQKRWYINDQFVSSADTIDQTFTADSQEVVAVPFSVNIPPLFERDSEDRCVEIPGRDESLLSKLFVNDLSQLSVGQMIKVSSPLNMPSPLEETSIYEVAEIHDDYIRIKVSGLQNILEFKKEPFQCRADSEERRNTLNNSVFYLNTVSLSAKTVRLDVVDSNGRMNSNTRNVNIVNISEPGILFHYDFELPVNTDGDISVVDVSGQNIHAEWGVGFDDQSLGAYGAGFDGRGAIFGTDRIDILDGSVRAPQINVPAARILNLEQFTIEFAMKKDEEDGAAGDFIYRHPNMLRFSNREDGTTDVTFNLFNSVNGENRQVSLSGNTASTDWQVIKVTYDGSVAKFYVNNVLQDSVGGLSGVFGVNTDYTGWNLVIGAAQWLNTGNYQQKVFNGMIDEFKFYDRAIGSLQ